MAMEGLEVARVPSPMTDQSGMIQYRKGMQDQLEGIFEMMFPKTRKYVENQEAAADAAKERMAKLKALRDAGG